MVTYTDEDIDRVIERTVGFYYEKTKHDIDLVLEATDSIKDQLEDIVRQDEFNELKSEVKLIRQAVTDTNKDLRQLDRRVGQLDKRVGLLAKDD